MNKILRDLTKEINDTNDFSYYKKVGNYEVSKVDNIIKHYYYGSTICVVDTKNKTFRLDACGYENYRLTTAQLNYLKDFYSNKFYDLVKDIR